MHDFHYHNNELYCEDVSIRSIADAVGTPFYLYSSHTLANHFTVFDSVLHSLTALRWQVPCSVLIQPEIRQLDSFQWAFEAPGP